MPPPSAKRPFGLVTTARLPLTRLFRSVSEPPFQMLTPPPTASLPTPPAVLSLTTVFLRVTGPALSMPPPLAQQNGQLTPPGQSATWEGSVAGGAAVLRVMTLSL